MQVPCHRLLFGLALAQGALSLLIWTTGRAPSGDPSEHVHELVFGHALAVIGGFLLTRLPPQKLLWVAVTWAVARLAHLLSLEPAVLRALLSLASSAAIALPAMRAFLRGAKRAESYVFPCLMIGILMAEGLFQLGALGMLPSSAPGAWLGLGLVVLLIVAMGGRLIGAAASGAAQRTGGARIAPTPRLELATIAALGLAFTAEALGVGGAVSATPLSAAALLLGVRLLVWLPGLSRSSGDILALAAGQAWLCIGILARAAAEIGLLTALPASSALHLATVGGIGGTTLVMMMRVSAQREARPMPVRSAPLATVLIGLAALLRAFGAAEHYVAAAVLWTVATLIAAHSVFARH